MASGVIGDTSFPVGLPGPLAGTPEPVLIAIGVVVAVVLLIRIWSRLHRAARQGRLKSSEVDPTKLPLTDFMREGHPGDPINLVVIGTDSQMGAAFASAGWYRADEINLITSIRIMLDAI